MQSLVRKIAFVVAEMGLRNTQFEDFFLEIRRFQKVSEHSF